MQLSNDRLQRIAAKMWNEGAQSVSDEEIERCLCGCVGKTKMIAWAKEARDAGHLTIEYINDL